VAPSSLLSFAAGAPPEPAPAPLPFAKAWSDSIHAGIVTQKGGGDAATFLASARDGFASKAVSMKLYAKAASICLAGLRGESDHAAEEWMKRQNVRVPSKLSRALVPIFRT
jgi:hypothetical protein